MIIHDDFKEIIASLEEMNTEYFFFASREIEALKRQIEGSGKCITFEALSAYLWQSQTKVLNFFVDQDSRLLFPINYHSRFQTLLPNGYYGNAIFSAYTKTKARNVTN